MDEVVQTMKRPRSHIQAMSNGTNYKREEQDEFNLDYVLPDSADPANINTPGRKTPQFDSRSHVSRVTSLDAGKQPRKSARTSLMG